MRRVLTLVSIVATVLLGAALPALAAPLGDAASMSDAVQTGAILAGGALTAAALMFAPVGSRGSARVLFKNDGAPTSGNTLSNLRTTTTFDNVIPTRVGYCEVIEIEQNFSFVFATASPTVVSEGVLEWLAMRLELELDKGYGGGTIVLHDHAILATLRALLDLYGYQWIVADSGFTGSSGTGVIRLRMVLPLSLLIAAANSSKKNREFLGWVYLPWVKNVRLTLTHQGFQSTTLFSADGANVSAMTSTIEIATTQHRQLPADAQLSLAAANQALFSDGKVASGGFAAMDAAVLMAHTANMELMARETRVFDSDLDASDTSGLIEQTDNRLYRRFMFSVDDATSHFEDGDIPATTEAIRIVDGRNVEILSFSERDLIQLARNRHNLTASGGTGRARLAGHYEIPFDKNDDGSGDISTYEGAKIKSLLNSNASIQANSRSLLMTEYMNNPANRGVVAAAA